MIMSVKHCRGQYVDLCTMTESVSSTLDINSKSALALIGGYISEAVNLSTKNIGMTD